LAFTARFWQAAAFRLAGNDRKTMLARRFAARAFGLLCGP